ncbi:hypothetical protein BS78_08G108500, partial [Paspalum vaginatum]
AATPSHEPPTAPASPPGVSRPDTWAHGAHGAPPPRAHSRPATRPLSPPPFISLSRTPLQPSLFSLPRRLVLRPPPLTTPASAPTADTSGPVPALIAPSASPPRPSRVSAIPPRSSRLQGGGPRDLDLPRP